MLSPARLSLLGLALLAASTIPGRAAAEDPKFPTGTWTWTWKDGEGKTHRHVLDVEAAAGKLTARERFDDLDAIKVDDLKLRGDEVTFSVKRGDRMAEYKGKLIGGKTINGQVSVATNGQANEFQWTAERAIEPKKQ
jgi:hypothetical protein